MQEAASTDPDESEENSDEDMEQEALEAGASDTHEGSTSNEEVPLRYNDSIYICRKI